MTEENNNDRATADSGEKKQEAAEPRPVGLDEFRVVDCEAPLANSVKLCCECFGSVYQKAAEAAEQQGDEASTRVYRLLAAVNQMHFKPEDRAEPYGPLLVMNGRRSMIPDDLRGETSAAFAVLAPDIKNPALRARIADLAWLNNKRNAVPARLAIASYCSAIQRVLDGEGELFFDHERASAHHGAEMLRRACQIANLTGWKEPEAGTLKALISAILKRTFDDRDADAISTWVLLPLTMELLTMAKSLSKPRHLRSTTNSIPRHPAVSGNWPPEPTDNMRTSWIATAA